MKTVLCSAVFLFVGAAMATEPANVPIFSCNRAETLAVFEENVFGRRPSMDGFRPTAEVVRTEEVADLNAIRKEIRLNTITPRGETNFTAVCYLPKVDRKVPAFVIVSLRPVGTIAPPDVNPQQDEGWLTYPRIPAKRILDRGFAFVMFHHASVFPDNKGSFDGIERPADGWGAISAWALAASRCLDWLETEKAVDAKKVAVIGHSRGGKTAIWAGVNDTRFAMTVSNCSGCCGAAQHSVRTPGRESIRVITEVFPYWFAPNLRARWLDKDRELGFETHQLLAMISPRLLAVGSGVDDTWASSQAEETAARLASRAWHDPLKVHYHCRPGGHGLLPADWDQYMDFADSRGWLPRGNPAFAKVLLKGRTDKENPLDYKVGEPITLTVSVEGTVPEGAWRLWWRRTGDDGRTEEGFAPCDRPLVVKTSLDRPGFVRVEARIVGEDGLQVHDRSFFDGGAGVETEKIRQAVPEPADFDAYWARQKKLLAAVPMKAEMKKLEPSQYECAPGHDVYAVKIDCAGPRPVTGYLYVPQGGKWPLNMNFHGYGASHPWNTSANYWCKEKKEIVFSINAHGFDLLRDDDYYDEFIDSIMTPRCTYAFSPAQNDRPETSYFNGMVLRVIRACEWAKTLEAWDGKALRLTGGSQGGLQVSWAMAHVEGVTVAEPVVTWCCDLGAGKVGRLRYLWNVPYADALGYFDAVNHAKRAKCPVNVLRAGLGDYVCPPSGLAAYYNAIPTKKQILWVQGSQHGYVPPKPNQEILLKK